MSKRNNLIIIGITLILYVINQLVKNYVPIEFIRWFMCCYFNDIIGGITFMAYVSIILNLYKRKITKLWQIELLMFVSGIFWEYVTPIYRKNTVSDIWDIVAYMMGGFIYWYIQRKYKSEY